MAKTQQEIHEVESIPWQPVAGYPGVFEKVLNQDPKTGSVSRLLKYAPGTVFNEVLEHDFYEEIYVLSGTLIDVGKKLTLKAGYYGYRHPGMKHGPYRSPDGMMTFEIRTYQE
ncbi:MAG: cupin domain-containing protein [Chloroflexi bacterium]|nr:cupin domain-containing protein [Chloroflexota bacterium]